MAELEHHESLIDSLLEKQAKLGTAVERFSNWHDSDHSEPAQARYYRNLIPFKKPGRGEQYAFEVNLDQCTGCKACVVACHSLNGLDDNESWRDVGLLLGDDYTPYQQTITSACHHCADPACANGCPVLAYEKDADTGIVRHLDDQCIGCSYCILKCPYDVPKYNSKRGIVRKCDMCQSRLSEGEAPACVQACPTSAIAIRIVEVAPRDFTSHTLLPGLIDSGYTRPTTRYVSSKPIPETADAADASMPRIEPAHTPLVIMLVLTQFAVGAILFAQNSAMLWTGFICAMLGIVASVLHLGQPLKAWRCFLGWRKSWLSREILAFGAFPPTAFAVAMNLIPSWIASMVGLVCVFCSVMVYVDTRRPFWAARWTVPRFFGSTMLGGLALAACFNQTYAPAVAVCGMIKLAWESLYVSSNDPRDCRAQRLLLGPLRSLHVARFITGLTGIALVLSSATAGFVCLMVGEILERIIFFRASAAWKMPGNA